MSVELSNISGAGPDAANAAVINEQVVNNDEGELGAVWDRFERDNGAERENGRFVSPDPEKRVPLEGGAEEGQADTSSTPDVVSVPLPANWQGKEEAWSKVPADLKPVLAEIDGGLHRTLSDQGRQISAFKPVLDVIERNKNLFDGSVKDENGRAITPAAGIEYLFNVQKAMDINPVETILTIADRYGARDKLAAALGQKPAEGQQGTQELRSVIAGLEQRIAALTNPAAIDERINRKLTEKAADEAAEAEIGRLAKDKPLYSEISEEDMVDSIHKARRKLGDAASKEAVFNLAYDMAVHADPDLRAKAAAAKPAAVADPKKVEAAKRANGVNVTSTSSGKGRALTEDEELAEAYDKAQKG